MIKTISYWALEEGLANTHSIDQALADAKAAGFEGLELAIGTEGTINTSTPEEVCHEIRQKIDASGLVVETLASGISWGVNPTSNDAETRKENVALYKDCLRRAAWLGCQSLLYVPGVTKSPICPDIVRYDIAVERAREAITELLKVAEEVDVELCIENVWNGLFYSPIEFAAFIDSFDSEKLGIYFDVGNVLGYHQHPPHWIEILGKRIKRVHVKDYTENFNWTGGYSFCDLGAGEVPWFETVEALQSIGYNKTIVAEMLPWSPGLLERTSAAMDVIFSKRTKNAESN